MADPLTREECSVLVYLIEQPAGLDVRSSVVYNSPLHESIVETTISTLETRLGLVETWFGCEGEKVGLTPLGTIFACRLTNRKER
jgi:hypothetical protein